MGFSHETSTHHFRLLSDGGAIEVTANDPKDKVTRDEIRNHLSHIVQMFTNGNFQIPMFIHDTVPPGVLVMKAKHASINYVFEQMQSGGRVRITTTDAEALKAVHQFLTFQIEDHAVWLEGTAHTIAALVVRAQVGGDSLPKLFEDLSTAVGFLNQLQIGQKELGMGQKVNGVVILSGEGLQAASSLMDTGFGFSYLPNLHIGATGWYVIAGLSGNPFQLGYGSFRR
jgi:hypothetical protein